MSDQFSRAKIVVVAEPPRLRRRYEDRDAAWKSRSLPRSGPCRLRVQAGQGRGGHRRSRRRGRSGLPDLDNRCRARAARRRTRRPSDDAAAHEWPAYAYRLVGGPFAQRVRRHRYGPRRTTDAPCARSLVRRLTGLAAARLGIGKSGCNPPRTARPAAEPRVPRAPRLACGCLSVQECHELASSAGPTATTRARSMQQTGRSGPRPRPRCRGPPSGGTTWETAVEGAEAECGAVSGADDLGVGRARSPSSLSRAAHGSGLPGKT
jgi:hypothetical protein